MFVRQPFDLNTLLSPGCAKSIEKVPNEPDVVASPLDLFTVDVNGYLGAFGEVLGGVSRLKPLGENRNVRVSPAITGTKPPSVQIETRRNGQPPISSRFGFTKH
jgi:hypothetical protein